MKHNTFSKEKIPDLRADHQWLEDWKSEAVFEFIQNENQKTKSSLEGRELFESLHGTAETVLGGEDPLANIWQGKDDQFYCLVKDRAHPSGILKKKVGEDWQTIADFEKLSQYFGQPLYYSMITSFLGDRCLLHLSEGGTDAHRIFEYDLNSQSPIDQSLGFDLACGKGTCYYLPDGSVLSVAESEIIERTLSHYSRRLRWHPRQEDRVSSQIFETLFCGDFADLGLFLLQIPGDDSTFLVERRINWDQAECFLFKFVDGRPELSKLFLPEGFSVAGLVDGDLILEVCDQRKVTWPGHSILALKLSDSLEGPDGALAPILVASAENVIESGDLKPFRNGFWGTRVLNFRRHPFVSLKKQSGWQVLSWPELGLQDEQASLAIRSVDSQGSAILRLQSFIAPAEDLVIHLPNKNQSWTRQLLQQSRQNDFSKTCVVQDHFCTSRDGTKVHYFLVTSSQANPQKPQPLYLTAYGGFALSRLPVYSSLLNELWLARGGSFVVANIRGGGEQGQDWHFVARREGRQRCYEDLAAVCEDLFVQGFTTAQQLVFAGGSNGGLLAGNMYTQFAQHFAGILCMNPLLDMRRYPYLFAGRNWLAEYGDPDCEEDWSFMKSWSPFHNVDPAQKHPPMFLTTAISDDRVHPAHARKMAALLREFGKSYLYYESLEGGHSSNTHIGNQAYEAALKFTFLWSCIVVTDTKDA